MHATKLLAAGLVTVSSLALADTASALTGVIKAPPGEQVVIQSRPTQAGKNLGLLNTGDRIKIRCQTYGQSVTGPYGTSTIWNKLANRRGWVTDSKTFTGHDGLATKLCGGGGSTPAANPLPGGRDAAQTTLRDDYGDQPANPYNFVTRNCTAFVAIRLNRGGVPIHNHWRAYWGNASRWAGVARSLGIRVDRTPRVGSVMQTASGGGGAGHVAVVSKVLSGNRILIEEYNYLRRHGYSQRTISAAGYEFIHFRR